MKLNAEMYLIPFQKVILHLEWNLLIFFQEFCVLPFFTQLQILEVEMVENKNTPKTNKNSW